MKSKCATSHSIFETRHEVHNPDHIEWHFSCKTLWWWYIWWNMCGRCVTNIRYIIMFCILFQYEYKRQDIGSLVQMHFACLDCVYLALCLLIWTLRVAAILEKYAIFNFRPILAKYKSFSFALMSETLDLDCIEVINLFWN